MLHFMHTFLTLLYMTEGIIPLINFTTTISVAYVIANTLQHLMLYLTICNLAKSLEEFKTQYVVGKAAMIPKYHWSEARPFTYLL